MALADNLVSFWKLNETGAGANAVDELGVNTLTNTNATTNQAGKLGTCFSFAGNGNLGPAGVNSYAIAANFSIAVWFKTTAGAGTFMHIAEDYHWDGHGWYIAHTDDPYIAFDCWDAAQTPTNCAALVDATPYEDGNWHFVVGTFDGTYARLYIDGNLVNTSSAWAHNVVYTGASFNMGSNEDIQNYFTGSIDSTGFWSRVLSDAEVTTLWNGGAGMTYPFSTYQGVLYIWNGSLWVPAPLKEYAPSAFTNRPTYACVTPGKWDLIQSF
jgi:hypothetical protein